MKITFICGSLEPGRDGVGDYTRRLAGELIKQQHEVLVIAFNDRQIKDTLKAVQYTDGVSINVLRITHLLSEKERFKQLKVCLERFKPDWVSLQYVPYSFQVKGIPFRFFNKLKDISVQANWHVMFHEIWLDTPKPLKQKLVELAQKFIVTTGLKYLKPQLVTVTIPYNQSRLNSAGITALILPLFGNISQSKSNRGSVYLNRAKQYPERILYLGAIPRHEFLEQVLTGLQNFTKMLPGKVCVIIVKGPSAEKDEFTSILNKKLNGYGADIIDCGFLENDELSDIMSMSTVGIVRSEPYLLGKSGVAIALLEHGTPIWLPKWTGDNQPELVFRKHLIYKELKKTVDYPPHESYQSLLSSVTSEFIIHLKNSK